MKANHVWRQSAFQNFKDEWLIKNIDNTQFEFLEFEPYKDQNYHQYGGLLTYYKLNIEDFSENTVSEVLAPWGLTLENTEEVNNEVIAQCLCEKDRWDKTGIAVQYIESHTLESLNKTLQRLDVNFKAYRKDKDAFSNIQVITFKEL